MTVYTHSVLVHVEVPLCSVSHALVHSLPSQALSGNVSNDLLNQMLKDEYIHKTPPKSTGREV